MVEDLYAIALAYYRAPLNYPELTDPTRALAEDLGDFLESAGGEKLSASLLAAAEYLAVPEQELLQAALFYIKQLLFAEGADYYRNLGLSATSTTAEIKRHNRLLIRIFHPDREERNGEWNESYAPRVIEAYSTLGKSDKRIDYDRQLLQQRSRTAPPGKHSQKKSRSHNPSAGSAATRQRFQVQQTASSPTARPWFLRAGILLFVGLLTILGVLSGLYYKVFEGPALLSGTSSLVPPSPSAEKKPIVKDVVTSLSSTENPFAEKIDLSEEALARILAGTAALGVEANNGKKVVKESDSTAVAARQKKKPGMRPAKPVKRRRKTPSVAKSKIPKAVRERMTGLPTGTALSGQSVVSRTGFVVGKVKRNNRGQQKLTSLTKDHAERTTGTGTSQPENFIGSSKENLKQEVPPELSIGESEAVNSPELVKNSLLATSPQSDLVTQSVADLPVEQLNLLLKNFTQAYKAGDINKFTKLFSANAQSGLEQGRDSIRSDYARLFTNSAARSMFFEGLRWRRSSTNLWWGTGAFQVVIINRAATSKKRLGGTATFAVMKRDNRLEITRFDYIVHTRSKDKVVSNTPQQRPQKSIIPVPKQELTELIEKFVKTYEQGSLVAFIQLFSSDSKTNDAQGRENIRQDYRQFFINSTSRKLEIKQMKWSRVTVDSIQGNGKIKVSARTGLLNLTHRYTGSVQFSLKRLQDEWKITKFFYEVQ